MDALAVESRRAALVMALAAAAVGAAATGLVAGGRAVADTPRPPGELLRPALISAWSGAPASRRLRVEVTHGVCSRGLRLTGLRMTARTVRLRVDEVFAPEQADLVCPAVAKLTCLTVTLPRARGGRSVVDAARGRRVPRTRSGPAAGGGRCRAAPR